MRVSKQTSAENRQRILAAAARLFREQGIDKAGVAAITSAAGLTHGAFYSQFESKEAVVEEAMRSVLDESRDSWEREAERRGGGDVLEAFIDSYLSRSHRNAPGAGCAIAALGSDIARQPKKIRAVFTKSLKENLDRLADLPDTDDAPLGDDVAIQQFSAMVGALILARAVDDEDFSQKILETVADGLKDSASD